MGHKDIGMRIMLLKVKPVRSTSGFTLVELLLAMSFLAMLLLMITFLILQVSTIYNKGLTLRSVNESGQLISSEIQRRLSSAPAETVGNIENVTLNNGTTNRLCADGVVYAWTPRSKKVAEDAKNISFVKFTGSKKDYCDKAADGSTPKELPETKYITSLIDKKGQALVIRSFKVDDISKNGIDGDTTQKLYQVSFTLGTDTDDLIGSNGLCKPPAEARQEFCAVNQFSFIAKTNSGGAK